MIKTLTLKNFQCHQKLQLDLGTITTIVGPTDAGKSSVLRALRWLCLNDFGGDEFIREGTKEAVAKIKLGKKTITRKKSKSNNTYEYDDSTFKSFGQTVPDPIAAKLSLDPINFQGQHDAPFWFTESAGEVSRELNRIIDLSVIDSALASVASRLRGAQGRKDLLRERIDALQRQAEAKNRQRISDFDRLQKVRKRLLASQEQKEVLNGMIMQIARIDVPLLLKRAADVKELLERSVKLIRLDRKIGTLEKLIEDCAKWEACKMTPGKFSAFTRIEADYKYWQFRKERDFRLQKLLEEMIRVSNKAMQWDLDADEFQSRIKEIEAGRVCPTCRRLL